MIADFGDESSMMKRDPHWVPLEGMAVVNLPDHLSSQQPLPGGLAGHGVATRPIRKSRTFPTACRSDITVAVCSSPPLGTPVGEWGGGVESRLPASGSCEGNSFQVPAAWRCCITVAFPLQPITRHLQTPRFLLRPGRLRTGL